ncbi:hypothetical protein POM88_032192 [Heracleum sosnowskyi]|uniref:Uncharacterized protein n=1 Tax=Heracleum sosnowskyi TaxID=360622 RepID=A0AAD8HYT1_9APIA|nr:hypothetical protein POM88_032192 [Heracleum sosnowskyi]
MEIDLEWGKGLAQKREAKARKQELVLEKSKPFARSRDDPQLDRMMKDRLRWVMQYSGLISFSFCVLVPSSLPLADILSSSASSLFFLPSSLAPCCCCWSPLTSLIASILPS